MVESIKQNKGCKCMECIFAKGKDDGLVHSPGDKPGDAIFCTNVNFLNESGYEVEKDPKYGDGALLYRVETLEGEDATCEAGIPNHHNTKRRNRNEETLGDNK